MAKIFRSVLKVEYVNTISDNKDIYRVYEYHYFFNILISKELVTNQVFYLDEAIMFCNKKSCKVKYTKELN